MRATASRSALARKISGIRTCPTTTASFSAPTATSARTPPQNPGYFDTLNASVTPLPKRFHVDGFIGDQAADWLARNGKEPFAAWVSFAGPHDPYDPPEEMADMYYNAPIPAPVGSRAELGKQAARPTDQAGKENIKNSMYRMEPFGGNAGAAPACGGPTTTPTSP